MKKPTIKLLVLSAFASVSMTVIAQPGSPSAFNGASANAAETHSNQQPKLTGGQSINTGNVAPAGQIKSQINANIEHRQEDGRQEGTRTIKKESLATPELSSVNDKKQNASDTAANARSAVMSNVNEKKEHASEMAGSAKSVLSSGGGGSSYIGIGIIMPPPASAEDVSQPLPTPKKSTGPTVDALPERKSDGQK